MDQKTFRNILNCESAVSEIIGVIMLLAIGVAMIALIQTQSVPEWNKAVEMDHYNVVYDDFLKLKSDIEDVALFQFPKSSVIHMGAHYPERMIFINPADTSGILTSKNDTWIEVSFTPYNSTEKSSVRLYSTSITFELENNYYANVPLIAYEHGLIIKNFTTNNYIYTDTDQAIFGTNTVNILSLKYPVGSESLSGTNVLNYNPESINSTYNNTNVTVTFSTNYPQLWSTLLKKNNLNYNRSGNTINVMYTGNTTINIYIVNGSLVSGTGVSATPTEFTYVSDIFDLLNITGYYTNFPAAQDASDGDASAAFEEYITYPVPDTYNYTYVTSNTDTSGTTTGFGNMTSNNSAYATLSEGSVISSDIPISPSKTIFNGTQSGSYSAARLNSNDNSIDVTNKKTIDTGYTTSWSFSSNTQSWTDTCAGSGGTCNMVWSWDHSGSLQSELTGSSSGRTATWRSTGFTWNNGIPDSASLDFDWRLKDDDYIASGNNYSVKLVKPDASEVYIYPNTTFPGYSSETWYSRSNSSISPSDFSQSGTYYIKLITLLKTTSSSGDVTFRWDNPTITLTKTRYSTDATYSFTQTKPNSSWVNITINDSSYAPAGTNVYIYNRTSSAWESIRTANFTNGTSDSSHVNNKVILNPSNYDTGGGVIKIKYEGIEVVPNSNIGIDLLQPVFYYNIYQMNVSTTISSIPGDLYYFLETYYRLGNTNEAGYNMDIWNYSSSSWGSTQSLTAVSWTKKNVTVTSSQISSGQVKTRFTDQTPTGTSRGDLSIDYQRIYGLTSGIPLMNHLNITTITTDIPDASNHTLQLRYYVSGDSFTLQVWNGSYWNNRAALTDTSWSYRNITLLSDELIQAGNAGDGYKYYARVRYLDMDVNPTQQGMLYLDYQRIYNN